LPIALTAKAKERPDPIHFDALLEPLEILGVAPATPSECAGNPDNRLESVPTITCSCAA